MTRGRENEPPMPDPLAYFLTWPTYGTWLPGDERGWIQYGRGWQLPDAVRKLEAEAKMTEDACRLDGEQRELVEQHEALVPCAGRFVQPGSFPRCAPCHRRCRTPGGNRLA